MLYLVSVGTFSIGIPFKYDGNEILSVTPKYEDLQKEIAEYEHIKFKKNYKEEILPKAEEYNKTVIGKTMELNSLICMILYTDFSKHSAQFTATFRKNSPFEPIQATKQRHRNFYWMSKILKEAVNNYGQPSAFLQGPFYCGMSRVMAMPQFAISLQSPTSTSCHIEVAKKFSGDHGLILQISNKGGDAQWVKGLDVSWLSRFKEEDERYDYMVRHYLSWSDD